MQKARVSMPTLRAARKTSSVWRIVPMSSRQVVPLPSSSTIPKVALKRTVSAVCAASNGQIFCCNQSSSSRSSA